MLALILAVVSSSTFASGPVVQDGTGPATPTPVVLELDQRYDNFFRLGDVVGAILEVARDGDFNDAIEQIMRSRPGRVASEIEKQRESLPVEFAVGIDDEAMEFLGCVLEFFFAATVLSGGLGDDGDVSPDVSRAELERGLNELVAIFESSVRQSALSMAARFRSNGEVARIVTLGNGFAVQLLGEELVTLVEDGFRVDVGVLLRDPGLLETVDTTLEYFGADEEGRQRALDRLRSTRVHVDVRQRDEWLVADLSMNGGRATRSREPLRAYPVVSPPFFYGRWDFAPLLRRVKNMGAFWERWGSTKIGKLAQEQDVDGAIADMRTLGSLLHQVGLQGVTTLALGPTVVYRTTTTAPVEYVDLRSNPLMKTVPRGAAWWADGTRSGASALHEYITDQEGRHSARSLVGDNPSYDEALDLYYSSLRDAREVLRLAAKEMPRGHVGVFDGGRPVSATVTWLAETTTADGETSEQRKGIVVSEFPVPTGAIVLRSDDALRDRGRIEELIRETLRGVIGEAPESVLVAIDLGLGVPTWGFAADLWNEVPVPATVKIEGDPDWQLHLISLDGVIVISTSPSTSRRIIAAAAAETPNIVLSDDEAIPCAFGDPVAVVTRYLDTIVSRSKDENFLRPAFGTSAERELADRERADARRIAEGLNDLVRRVQKLEYQDRIADGRRESVLRFGITSSKAARDRSKSHMDEVTERLLGDRTSSVRWLTAQQREDGRWSAGDGAHDVFLTALAIDTLGRRFVPGAVQAKERGFAWLESVQVTDGDAKGHFGEPGHPAAFLNQCAAAYLWLDRMGPGGRRAESSTASLAEERLKQLSPARMTDLELLWAERAKGAVGMRDFLSMDGGETFEVIAAAIDAWIAEREGTPRRWQSLGLVWALPSSVPNLSEAVIAECRRLSAPSASWPEDLQLFEVFEFAGWLWHGRLVEDHELPIEATNAWAKRWRTYLLEARRNDGPQAGSWPTFGVPFGGDLLTSLFATRILNHLEFADEEKADDGK